MFPINKKIEELAEARAAEMLKMLNKTVKAIKIPLKERDEIKEKIANFKEKTLGYHDRVEKRLVKQENLKLKIPDILAKGEDPGEISKEIRAIGVEAEDLNSWIRQIEGGAIPKATNELAQAENNLLEALSKEMFAVLKKYTEEANEKLAAVEVDVKGWQKALGQFGKSLDVSISPLQFSMRPKNVAVRNIMGG